MYSCKGLDKYLAVWVVLTLPVFVLRKSVSPSPLRMLYAQKLLVALFIICGNVFTVLR